MSQQTSTHTGQTSDLGWTVLPDGSVDFHGLADQDTEFVPTEGAEIVEIETDEGIVRYEI